MAQTVADVVVATLKMSGVQRVCGVPGELPVCAGSCGPGNLHLVNGLYDANRSGGPVLAIAAHIPRAEIGGGYSAFSPVGPDEGRR